MSGLLKVGSGRLSGCTQKGEDIIVIICDGGALRRYSVSPLREVTDCGIVSYATDVYEFSNGTLSLGKEAEYHCEV